MEKIRSNRKKRILALSLIQRSFIENVALEKWYEGGKSIEFDDCLLELNKEINLKVNFCLIRLWDGPEKPKYVG